MKYKLLRAAIKSKDLQKAHMLKDCNLVIDGRTYFQKMYRNSGCQFIIGGEYDRFAMYLRNQLKTFIDSNVTCYVIFNGGMKAEIGRRKEIHQGIIDKTDAVLPFADNYDYCEPIFVKDVCKEVLTELGIKFFVAEYDNREALINVAKKLRCPILTSSYEYCHYSTSCITPKSLSYDEGHRSISCRIIHAQDCIGVFRMKFNLVPIFLTLMDEDGDYIKNLPAIKTRKKNKTAMAVYFWIKRQTLDTAFKEIGRNMENEAQKTEFTNSYVDQINLFRFSNKALAINYFGINKNQEGNTTSFENTIADGTVAIPYVNLKNNSTFSGSWLIVDKNEDDAMIPAMDIVKYVNAILAESSKGKITFIGRKSGKSNVWDIEWNYDEPVPKGLWSKDRVKRHTSQTPEEDIFFNFFLEKTLPGFKLETLQSLPEDSWMIMITLVYYSIMKKGVDMRLVSSMLLSYVMVGPVSERIGIIKRSTFVGLSIVDDDKTQELSSKDCENAAKTLVDLFDATNIRFDRRILHTLAEFQHCLQHINYLNKLCGEKIQCTVYHKALNILFVYNAYIKMGENDIQHPLRYFEKCLGKSSVLKHFEKFRRVFFDCFSSVKK